MNALLPGAKTRRAALIIGLTATMFTLAALLLIDGGIEELLISILKWVRERGWWGWATLVAVQVVICMLGNAGSLPVMFAYTYSGATASEALFATAHRSNRLMRYIGRCSSWGLLRP